MRYVEHKKNAPDSHRNLVYERALKELPGRYTFLHEITNGYEPDVELYQLKEARNEIAQRVKLSPLTQITD